MPSSSLVQCQAEYGSVSFRSSLTQEQSRKLEGIQRTCAKVIIGDNYLCYQSASEMLGLESLEKRRQKRCLDFSLKCLKHPRNIRLSPRNFNSNNHNLRGHEKFLVNFAKTSCYQKSAIPYCQRLLSEHFATKS